MLLPKIASVQDARQLYVSCEFFFEGMKLMKSYNIDALINTGASVYLEKKRCFPKDVGIPSTSVCLQREVLTDYPPSHQVLWYRISLIMFDEHPLDILIGNDFSCQHISLTIYDKWNYCIYPY